MFVNAPDVLSASEGNEIPTEGRRDMARPMGSESAGAAVSEQVGKYLRHTVFRPRSILRRSFSL